MKNFILFLPFTILLMIFLYQGLQRKHHTWWFPSGVISMGSGHISLKWQNSIISTFTTAKPQYEKSESSDSFINRFFDRRALLPYYSPPPGPYSLRIPIWIPLATVFFILFMFRSKKGQQPR